MRSRSRRTRGATTVVVALTLIAIIGMVALALDGGLLFDNKRNVQAAADAAALAAATEIFDNYGDGLDGSGKAKASALSTATANGYTSDGVNSIVTVNIPPSSGTFSGKAGYAEVVIQTNQARTFSGVFGSGAVPVKARAVGWGSPGNVAILMLDHTLMAALEVDGIVKILNDGQIWVNSDGSEKNDSSLTGAGYVAGTAKLTMGGINIVGNLNQIGTVTYTGGGNLKKVTKQLADPLANVPEPVPSGTNYGNKSYSGTATMQPGIYGDITIANNAYVTMGAGIYYIGSSGSLQVGNNATLKGDGVMIYNDAGDNLKFGNNVTVRLTPPTSGPYRGISLWIPRDHVKEIHISADGSITMSGTLYAQAGEFDLRPNNSDTEFHFGAYICDQAEWGQGYGAGKSDGTIYMDATTAAPTQRPILVD